MGYRVEIARRAEADLEELYLWVVERAPQQGAKWFNGLERAVLSLNQHPKRCPVAPESFDPDRPVRVLTYGQRAGQPRWTPKTGH
jgi:plasmid stabilization system protein ParE